jgi:hypothetical protein
MFINSSMLFAARLFGVCAREGIAISSAMPTAR